MNENIRIHPAPHFRVNARLDMMLRHGCESAARVRQRRAGYMLRRSPGFQRAMRYTERAAPARPKLALNKEESINQSKGGVYKSI